MTEYSNYALLQVAVFVHSLFGYAIEPNCAFGYMHSYPVLTEKGARNHDEEIFRFETHIFSFLFFFYFDSRTFIGKIRIYYSIWRLMYEKKCERTCSVRSRVIPEGQFTKFVNMLLKIRRHDRHVPFIQLHPQRVRHLYIMTREIIIELHKSGR